MNLPDPAIWPKITVVTPSYNQAQYLEQTMLSVLGQGYPHLEYIVMDGGSTDGSVEIIQRFSSQLAYWTSAKDRGQSDAINRGMARATGDIVCWLNSDDYFLPGTLFHVARQLSPHLPKPALVYGSCLFFRESDGAVRILKARPYDDAVFRETHFIYQPSSFWTRAMWEKAGSLDMSMHYAFDWEWFLRAATHGQLFHTPQILSAYRRHAQHKSGTGGEARRQEMLEVVKRYGSDEQIRIYAEAAHLYEAYEKRNRTLRFLKDNRVPFAGYLANLAHPTLWFLPPPLNRERLTRCMGMLSAS